MSTHVEISIVIPTRNKAPRLRLTLAALSAQRCSKPFELVVVNDGSTDETDSMLQQVAPEVRVLRDCGRGRSAARNRGAHAASGRLIVFLDDDILTTAGFLEAHLRAQRHGPGLIHGRLREMVGVANVRDPRMGGPGAPPLDPVLLATEGFKPEGYRLMSNALERAAEGVFANTIPVSARWLSSAGANLSIPRELWLAVGGFDESFGTTWGCEDLDFALRVQQHGRSIGFTEKALGVHLTHAEGERWAEHAKNLDRLIARFPLPEVRALGKLLGPDGCPTLYAQEVFRLRGHPSTPTTSVPHGS